MGLEIYRISLQGSAPVCGVHLAFGTGIVLDMFLISQADMSRYTKATANT